MNIEPELAARIVETPFGALDQETVVAARTDVIDTLGVAVAGRRALGIEALIDLIEEESQGGCTLIASEQKALAVSAALVNSSMAHAYDFDDTHDTGVVHAGVTVIPAALAVAEMIGASGRDFMTAVVLGVEFVCRLALATYDGPNTSGWMLTPLYGTFGVAAAVGRLLGLSISQMQHALGLAYSQAAGNVQCVPDGALAKRLQVGFSAQAGVRAALLAERGLTGPLRFLDGPFGLARVYHKGRFNSRAVLADWGPPFAITQLSFKPYPTCRFTHTSIDAAISLTQREKLSWTDIASVRVRVNAQALAATGTPIEVKQQPRTVVDAQFSIPYTVAVALRRGGFNLGDLEPRGLADAETLALARRISVETEFSWRNGADRQISPAVLMVRTHSGTEHEACADIARGHYTMPLTDEEMDAKFLECWYHTFASRPGSGAVLLETLHQLEMVDNLRSVTCLLAKTSSESSPQPAGR